MKSFIGTLVDEVRFTVEQGKVAEFARATQARDSIHVEPSVAAEAGLANLAATATHVVVAGHQRHQRAFVDALGLDLKRIVVGSVKWRYNRPLVVGDQVHGIRRVIADDSKQGKRGGLMRILTLQTEFTDTSGEVVVTQEEVLIEKGVQ